MSELEFNHLAGIHLAAPLDSLGEPLGLGGWEDQIAGEPIVRLVVEERLVQPGGDLLAAAVDVPGPLVLVVEQVVPKGKPVVGVGPFVVEQPTNEGGPLDGGRIGEKGFELARSREQANEVEVDPAGECGIVERRRGRQLVLGEIDMQNSVDRVAVADG